MSVTPMPMQTEYLMFSPEGKTVKVPKELFEAFMEFLATKRNGQVIAQMRNGGVAGVEMISKLK